MSIPEGGAAVGIGANDGGGPRSHPAFAPEPADLVKLPSVTAGQADSARPAGRAGEPLIGRVIEPLADGLYRVELADGHKVLVHLAGKARIQAVRILPGDRVELELSAADPGRGRILRRLA